MREYCEKRNKLEEQRTAIKVAYFATIIVVYAVLFSLGHAWLTGTLTRTHAIAAAVAVLPAFTINFASMLALDKNYSNIEEVEEAEKLRRRGNRERKCNTWSA